MKHLLVPSSHEPEGVEGGGESSLEGDGGLEGGEGSLSPFNHKPNYTGRFEMATRHVRAAGLRRFLAFQTRG